MFEIACIVMDHADPLHHGTRAQIVTRRERYDFIEKEMVKGVGKNGFGGFRRIALPPQIAPHPPADFNGWRERRIEIDMFQANETCKRRDTGNFKRPYSITMMLEMQVEPVNQRIALCAG